MPELFDQFDSFIKKGYIPPKKKSEPTGQPIMVVPTFVPAYQNRLYSEFDQFKTQNFNNQRPIIVQNNDAVDLNLPSRSSIVLGPPKTQPQPQKIVQVRSITPLITPVIPQPIQIVVNKPQAQSIQYQVPTPVPVPMPVQYIPNPSQKVIQYNSASTTRSTNPFHFF